MPADPPPPAPGCMTTFAELIAGRLHTCGRLVAGPVYCWGDNHLDQLGRDTAPLVAGGCGEVRLAGARLDAVALGVGRDHSCAALRDGRVICWGSNSEGQLGAWVPGFMTFAPVVPDFY
jgi:alpha-tubulin suppressor-like RCC1 family protein